MREAFKIFPLHSEQKEQKYQIAKIWGPATSVFYNNSAHQSKKGLVYNIKLAKILYGTARETMISNRPEQTKY
jgi:hypothetical protein